MTTKQIRDTAFEARISVMACPYINLTKRELAQYQGCGHATVRVVDGKVTHIEYDPATGLDSDDLPEGGARYYGMMSCCQLCDPELCT